jgi:4'-phosphopantetheinyl transferase EntD
MIDRLVPPTVAVASTRADVEAEPFPEEARALGRAVETRRREFVTGRACARQALARLGRAPVAIPSGPRGEPLWPPGVVGSITHCRGYRACAVAEAADLRSVGIDAEVDAPLPEGVLDEVAFGRERAMVARAGASVCLDRLLFSAKEAIYKAWFPVAERWLGFEDVELTIDVAGGAFRAELLVPGPVVDGRRLTELHGRWCARDGLVATAAFLPADDGPTRMRKAR